VLKVKATGSGGIAAASGPVMIDRGEARSDIFGGGIGDVVYPMLKAV